MLQKLKKKGLYKLGKGKRELTREGYVIICYKLMTLAPQGMQYV